MSTEFTWVNDNQYKLIKERIILNQKNYNAMQRSEIEAGFRYFQEHYSYEILSNMSEKDLMRCIYLWAPKGLIYDCMKEFGNYGNSGSRGSNKIYKLSEKGDWYYGDTRVDLGQEVYEELLTFSRGFVSCLELIEIAGDILSIKEYYELEKEIRKLIGVKLENNWVQKAFHMLYPSTFAEIYDSDGKRNWQKNALCAFQVKPHSKSFIMNGQLALIAKELDYENGYYFAHDIYNTFGWLNHTHVYRLVLDDDCREEFEHWIKDSVVSMRLTNKAFQTARDNIDRGIMEYSIVVVTCNDEVLGVAHDLKGQYGTDSKYRYRYYRKCKWRYRGTGVEQLPVPDEGSRIGFSELVSDENVAYVYDLFYDNSQDTNIIEGTSGDGNSATHIVRGRESLPTENESTYNENKDLNIREKEDRETRISRIDSDEITGDVKEIVVKARINQDVFRDRLVQKYGRCCLCGVDNERLLIASHIKPWRVSNPEEKLDVNNGLLLCPNHDALFDKGMISFDDDGQILISESLSEANRIYLNVRDEMRIDFSDENIPYLRFHRNNVFVDDQN